MEAHLDVELSEFRAQVGEALAEGGTQALTRLTDEELAVLDPQETFIPKPHLSAMNAQQREWVMAAALRSLVSREAVEIVNIGELDAVLLGGPQIPVDLRIRMDVDLALTLRRTADRVLAVKQESATGTAFGYVHIHSANLLLVERITAGGMHLFTLAGTVQDVVKLVLPLVDPLGVADRDGESRPLDPSTLDREHVGSLASVIDNARVVGQMVLLNEPPGPLMMTYATDRAVWAVVVDGPHALSGVTARPVSAATLSRRIADMMSTGNPETGHA
ncbi:hypothetical protein OUY22_02445 [Nonomuraea sp. MCN248]|uniref:ESX secretion-associated protein EspG n=1 Tax=Nonomuraea corallina TaxID=2989783 RepID=A0ABT4S4X6_9ACTN|nr:hypothetical protein [Nonomuraea corallina]MDA0632262.1 hypothetical protein [Nonomuraea corallina]